MTHHERDAQDDAWQQKGTWPLRGLVILLCMVVTGGIGMAITRAMVALGAWAAHVAGQ